MNVRWMAYAMAVAALGFPLHFVAPASAEPGFGPGIWDVHRADDGSVEGTFNVVADCGTDCLTVHGGDEMATFTLQPEGNWTGSWQVVDGECYDQSGNTMPNTATWNSHFVVSPDLTMVNHVVDLKACEGGTNVYDEHYYLTRAPR